MAEFVWKKRPRQNLVCNNGKKLMCFYLRLEFEKWRGICDGVGDVRILGDALFLNSFLKSARKRIQFYFLEFPFDI